MGRNEQSIIKRIWWIIRPYTRRVIIAIVFSALVSCTNGAIAWLVKPAMDYIFVEKEYGLLWLLPLGILALYILRGLGSLLQAYYMQTSGFKLIRDMRVRCFETIVNLPVSTVQRWSSGEMLSRVMSDIGLLSKILSDSLKTFLIQVPSLFVLMGVALYRRWDLTLLSFILLPVIALFTKKMSQYLKKKRKDVQGAMAILTHRMNEIMQGIKVIKIFTLEKTKTEQFKREAQVHYHQNARLVRIKEGTKFMTECLSGIAVSLIIGYGSYLVVKGEMTSGAFFSVLTAIVMAFAPLQKLGRSYGTFQESVGVLERVEDFLALGPETGGSRRPEGLKHGIRFDSVTFVYPGTQEPILKAIDLFIPRGKTIAIVGPSGAGKSTIVDLIPRFFDPTKGKILWDDHDLRDLDIKELRRQIGLVTQDVVLFGDTIIENIMYGRPDASEDEVIKAAKMAQAHEFIVKLPKGYHTVLDDRGLNLSGGQRQRIAIARALLKDPQVLILDEATSALDTISEHGVQEALRVARKGRTTLIIAHRMSTIQDADTIVVLDNGEIKATGTHSELISTDSLYQELYRQLEKDAGEDQCGSS